MEKIKDIPEYEGLYGITENGEVFSYPKVCSSKNGLWLKQNVVTNRKKRSKPRSFKAVGLYKDKKRKVFQIHRVVAITYISNPKNKPDINHIDGDTFNNHVSNLEWTTKKENMEHALRTGLYDPHTEKQIRIRTENLRKLHLKQKNNMKKLAITVVLITTFFAGKAQTGKIDSTLAVQLTQMADDIIEFDTINYRPILIADSVQNYYATMNEFALKFDRAMILMWNQDGERIRLWLRKTKLPEMEIQTKPKKIKLPYKVKKTKLPYKVEEVENLK